MTKVGTTKVGWDSELIDQVSSKSPESVHCNGLMSWRIKPKFDEHPKQRCYALPLKLPKPKFDELIKLMKFQYYSQATRPPPKKFLKKKKSRSIAYKETMILSKCIMSTFNMINSSICKSNKISKSHS